MPGRCETDPHHAPIDQAAAEPSGCQRRRVAAGASARRLAAGLPAAAALNTPRAFLGYAIECLLDLRDGTGWDSEYQRDVWLLRRLGVTGHDGARLDFTAVQPLWLRDLAKRWCRWRMSCGVGLGQLRNDRIALVRLSQLTPGLATSSGPNALDRAALEGYLARLAVEIPHPKTRSTEIGAVTGFLHAVRQHRWASLPAEAQLYPSDHPRRDETPAPRAIPEFVMHQLESPANLDRISDPRIRLLVEILIRTGLRIGDATRLALDCLVRDPQGAVYLRYRNHKMRRDAVVPIDDELAAMIEAQQARTRQRFPTTGVLLPRSSANPDGRLAIPTATFHRQLGLWLETCGVTDELGRPVHVTAHQFRHSYATRLINHDVPQEVVRRLLDHTSHTMTAVYARLADTTIRQQWERAQKINIHGEPVDTTVDGPLADGEWMKQNLARAKMALPNGYCGLPLQKSCPHANACLTCPLFVTTAEFLPQHRKQLDDTRALIAHAETDGHTRMAEMNRTVETNLLTIITTLEADHRLPVRATGSETCCGKESSDAPDNSHHLVAAAQRRRADTLERAREPCTNSAKPAAAHRHADRRPRRRLPLMALRPARTTRPTPRSPLAAAETAPAPTIERGSDASLRQRLTLAHERIRELDNENRQLRNQIAHLHGQLRANRIASTPSRTLSTTQTPSHTAKQSNPPKITIVDSSSRHLRRSSRSSRLSSLDTPAASPASTSAWRTHLRSVSGFMPSRPAIARIAAHSES